MGQNSLKKNAVYNTIRSISAIVFPLITYPYATRVLGAGNLGKVGMAISIVSYFSLIAVFGISSYAVRECAAVRDDRAAIDRAASELLSFNVLTTVIALVLLALCVFIVKPFQAYTILILIQSLSIVFTTIGLDWVNVIFEDYKYISVRSILINIINLILLFVFVKKPEDYYIYSVLTVSSVVIIGILNFFYIRRYVSLRPAFKGLGKYVHDLMPFFVNEIGIVIYVSSDTTILGLMKGDYPVGIYNVAVKIYSIVKSVFIAIYSVTLPRMAHYAAEDDMDGFNKILSGTISVFILLAFPAVVGMALYAGDILEICGSEYREGTIALRFLSIALFFAVFGGIVTRCVNIPLGYERTNSSVTLIAAAENIILNIPMIYLFSERGAAATTALAELSVLLLCIIHLKKEHVHISGVIQGADIRDTILGIIPMLIIYAIVMKTVDNYILRLLAGVMSSVIAYAAVLLVMKNQIMSEILTRVRSRHGD